MVLTPGSPAEFVLPSQLVADGPIVPFEGAFTLRLLVELQADRERRNRPILTLLERSGVPTLAVGQWPGGVYFTSRRTNPGGDPRDDHYARLAVGTGPVELVLEGDAERLALLADGRILVAAPVVPPQHRTLRGTLVAGAVAPGRAPWRGRLHEAALYADSADAGALGPPQVAYDFRAVRGRAVKAQPASAPTMRAPDQVSAVLRGWLDVPTVEPGAPDWLGRDVAINLLGFVPFGWLVARGRARPWLLALAAGFATSLFIETIQLWIPGRSSSAVDLACNALGSLVGGVLAGWRQRATRSAR